MAKQISDTAVLAKAQALADRSALEPYKGRDVLRTSIKITNAGDGLSNAMAIAPQELDLGSTVYVILKCEVASHEYDPIKDTDALELAQVLKAGDSTLADKDLVAHLIQEQADRITAAKEKAAGLLRIEFPDASGGDGGPLDGGDGDEEDETAVLVRQHNAGVHADERREGCPPCDAEAALEAEGR